MMLELERLKAEKVAKWQKEKEESGDCSSLTDKEWLDSKNTKCKGATSVTYARNRHWKDLHEPKKQERDV